MFANAKYRALLLPTLAAAVLLILAALLLGDEPAGAQSGAATVTAVAITSDAGNDDTYLIGDAIRITLTFSQAVNVTGAPQLAIDMDPAEWGEKPAAYESGSGSATLTFTHTVVEPNLSTQGIAVLADSLALNGGTIKSASSDTDADLSHAALAHDASHKVNWQISAATVSAVAITSDAGDDDTYLLGETIHVTLTFSEAVSVTGTPQLSIDMDPADWGTKQANYHAGTGTTSLVFTHTVVEPNLSTQGIAVLADSLALNGGSIQSASSQIDASLSHAGLGHDASHKVDWQQTEPNHAPVINTESAGYADFTFRGNAPRGYLVSKRFDGIFSDPDGDELTYTASVPAGQSHLVEMLETHLDVTTSSGEQMDFLFFRAEAEADWKAMNPQPPVRPVVTVTLTATDPGGLSASVNGDFLIHWETYPELQSAVAGQQAITLTYDMAVLDDPAPTPAQFTVNVVNADGSTGTIPVSSVTVNGTVVTLELASELAAGQTVTFGYANATDTPLRAASGWGDRAPWFRDHAVDTSQLGLPGAVANFSVSAEPGMKNVLVTWDAVEGATSYKLRWRKSGGEFQAADAATVSGAPLAIITVSGYGQWEVWAQACNDAGCGPETSGSTEVAKAASLTLARSGSRTIAATWEQVADAASYKLSWERISLDSPAPGQGATDAREVRSVADASAAGGPTASAPISNQLTVPADRTDAELSVPDGGAYQVELRVQSDDDELIALAHSHVDQDPGLPDTTPPRMEWGEIDGNRIRLYFSEPLDETVTMARFHPEVRYGNCWCSRGGTRDLAVDIDGNVLTANLGRLRAIEGRWAAVRYVYGLRDVAGNAVSNPWQWLELRNITGRPYVTGAAISSDAGADRYYALADTIKVDLSFSEAVDVTGTPRVRIDLDPADGGEKWATYHAGSGTRTLTFAYTVADGDLSTDGVAVLENTLELNGGTIRAAWATAVENARLAHLGRLPNSHHRVVTADSAAPLLLSASVTETTLTLTFNEALAAAETLEELSNDAFTVQKGSAEETVNLSGSPAISGSTVTLTLETAVSPTDAFVKVGYTKPTSGVNNKLVDAGGDEVEDFSDRWVANTLDTTQPTLVRGEIDGDVITLYFSEPLDEHSGGWGDHYWIGLQWSSLFGDAPHHGRCKTGPLWRSFTAIPRDVYVSDNTVVVVGLYERASDKEKWRAGVGQNTNNFRYMVDLTAPAEQRLRDLSGNLVSTPDHRTDTLWRTEHIFLPSVTQLPYPKSAAVVGNQLTLTFSAPMDRGSKPAASALTVKVNGSAASLASANPMSMSGTDVTLTLAAAVASGDTVTVSYVRPSAGPLQNTICEDAPSFTDQAVTNATP